MRTGVALALLTAGSLALRAGTLGSGYWIDEAIAVGIASHPPGEISSLLRQDGSPPLYYVLLHGWMALFGSGEAATRSLSLVFAGLAVPVAWWAGGAVAGRRAAAAGAAVCPFLTYYAQEARMYTLVALLSLVAAAAFTLAVVHGRRRHLVTLAAALVALLYTHTWAVFLVAGMAVAWAAERGRAGEAPVTGRAAPLGALDEPVTGRAAPLGARDEPVTGRAALLVGAVVALAYAPWVPTLVFQSLHTGAPWAERPSPLYLLVVPAGWLGYAILVRRGPGGEAIRPLLVMAAAGVGLAWAVAQVQPAWSARYFAVLFGPLLLAPAGALARGGRVTAVVLATAAAAWLLAPSPPARSNVRAVAEHAAVRPGDLVVSTQPEQVPVLHRYLPAGVAYLTPLGTPADPSMLDWRDALPRIQAAGGPDLRGLASGRRVLLVTPVGLRSRSPWGRAVRARTRVWRSIVRADPRLRRIARTPRPDPARFRSAVRAELYEVDAAIEASASWSTPALERTQVRP